MSLNAEFREIWRQVLQAIRKESRAAVAPFTVGGKLNLSSPHIVGTLPPERGGAVPGTGSPVPPPPDTYAYLTDASGDYLTDTDGAYLFEYL